MGTGATVSLHNAFGAVMENKNGIYDNARSAAQSGAVVQVSTALETSSTYAAGGLLQLSRYG
ncbi:MAG: hypothetical protein LBJ03_03690 [Holosporales bacterium]|nr:hypothetical protein [Holosporales bacterium]